MTDVHSLENHNSGNSIGYSVQQMIGSSKDQETSVVVSSNKVDMAPPVAEGPNTASVEDRGFNNITNNHHFKGGMEKREYMGHPNHFAPPNHFMNPPPFPHNSHYNKYPNKFRNPNQFRGGHQAPFMPFNHHHSAPHHHHNNNHHNNNQHRGRNNHFNKNNNFLNDQANFPQLNHEQNNNPLHPQDFRSFPPTRPFKSNTFVIVEFKRERLKKFECLATVSTGDYVIVDGDRGPDCGLVVQQQIKSDGKIEKLTLDGASIDDSRIKLQRGKVLRKASAEEEHILHNILPEKERVAFRVCREKCAELNLPIEVVDCEYQFDMKKISFFFKSESTVDFRQLVKFLYDAFHVRIWMENINPLVMNLVPEGAISRHQKEAMKKKTRPFE